MATPLFSSIIELPHLWDNFWSALTGIGTCSLAFVTYFVLRQTNKEISRSERRHRDQFKPIVTASNHKPRIGGTMKMLENKLPFSNDNSVKIKFLLNIILLNIGYGPAFNVAFSIVIPHLNFAIKPIENEFKEPILQNNGYRFYSIAEINIIVKEKNFDENFHEQGVHIFIDIDENALSKTIAIYENSAFLRITYSDIFGQQFVSCYALNNYHYENGSSGTATREIKIGANLEGPLQIAERFKK